MSSDIKAGTMLMREGVFLPSSVTVQSVPYCDTWRELKGIDTYTLDREVRSSGWNLFFVAGELRTRVRGRGAVSLRRGIERLATRVSAAHFNCLQIGEIVRKHFLGFPYLALSAHAYHIQDARSLHVAPAAPVDFVSRISRLLW
jgi:hypothetical protein